MAKRLENELLKALMPGENMSILVGMDHHFRTGKEGAIIRFVKIVFGQF